MNLEQLMGKYRRMRAELAAAYSTAVPETRHVSRLSQEIVGLESELTKVQADDEQTNDWLPGLLEPHAARQQSG